MGARLSEQSKSLVLEYFESRLQRHGASHVALGWCSRKSQRARFRALCEVGDLDGGTVLDVGCGLGDLWRYLKTRHIACRYIGVDLSGAMVKAASKLHREVEFLQADILDVQFPDLFDYVLASGVYNLEVGDNEEVMPLIIKRMFELSKKAVAATMTRRQGAYGVGEHAYDPAKIEAFVRSLSPFVTVREDYLCNDFALYVFHTGSATAPAGH